jgi:hypothetical protein
MCLHGGRTDRVLSFDIQGPFESPHPTTTTQGEK